MPTPRLIGVKLLAIGALPKLLNEDGMDAAAATSAARVKKVLREMDIEIGKIGMLTGANRTNDGTGWRFSLIEVLMLQYFV